MPTISVDTFFACSLMVLLVLSAMANTSRILSPYVNNEVDVNAAERYREISSYMLLNEGTPPDWGKNSTAIPETFGLARYASETPYELDIDKVTRLNSENLYAVNYARLFTSLKMPDVSFRLEIKPVFETRASLTATFEGADETTYEFEILTQKHGNPVEADLKCYVVAENYFGTTLVNDSGGTTSINITLPNSVGGPALLVVFAKAINDIGIVSFGVQGFAHNSAESQPKGTYLRLSPLDYTLNVSQHYSETNLSTAYALSFTYSSTMSQTAINNQSSAFAIPHFLDTSPMITVVTGSNSSLFFEEWSAYPQVPLQTGADFAGSPTLSNVFSFTYLVTINSALYECTVWLGGPRE